MSIRSIYEAYVQVLTEEAERQNNTMLTQVSTTGGSYKKAGELLAKHLPDNSVVLSGGAGLDHTKPALLSGLGGTHQVHDFEPNPGRRKAPPEFSDDANIPNNHYDGQVWMNVHNVVEPHVREHIYNTIFRTAKEGGHVVIGARKWAGDVAMTKNFEPGVEKNSIWVNKAKGEKSYQKGYDGNELKDEVESHAKRLGHEVEVTKVGNIAAAGVHVKIKKKSA